MKNQVEYRIKLTETTKVYPKSCFYVCEITGVLQTTEDEAISFVTDSYGVAIGVVEFVEVNYDYKATVIIKDKLK